MNLFLASKKNKKWLKNCKNQIKLTKTKIYIFYGLRFKKKKPAKICKEKASMFEIFFVDYLNSLAFSLHISYIIFSLLYNLVTKTYSLFLDESISFASFILKTIVNLLIPNFSTNPMSFSLFKPLKNFTVMVCYPYYTILFCVD